MTANLFGIESAALPVKLGGRQTTTISKIEPFPSSGVAVRVSMITTTKTQALQASPVVMWVGTHTQKSLSQLNCW